MCHVGYTFLLGLVFTTETINKMLNCHLGYDNIVWFVLCLIMTLNAVKFQYTEYFPTELENPSTCCDHTTE